MKLFKPAGAFVLALAVIVGLLPATLLFVKAAAPAVGKNVLHASYSEDGVTVDGKLNEPLYRRAISPGGAWKVSAVWNWTNLYLAFADTPAPAVTELKVNGQAVTTAGVADTGSEIQIPLASVGITTPDQTEGYTLSFKIGGTAWEGKILFDTSNYAPLQYSKIYYSAVGSQDKYSVTLDTAAAGNNANRSVCSYRSAALQSSVEAPTVLELDITVNHMPDNATVSGANREFCRGGVGLTIRDENTAVDKSDKYGSEALLLGLCKQEGRMKLVYWADGAYRTADVAAAQNNLYHIRVEYSYAADETVSAKYFVNGTMVAEAVRVKSTGGSFSTKDTNIIQILTKATDDTAANRVNVVVSNLSVGKPQTLEKPTDLEPLTPEYFFERIDLTHVRSDLPLAAQFTGKSGKVHPLTWIIGDTTLVSPEGKITRPATEAKSTTLTLQADGQTLWTVTVTVDPLAVAEQESPEKMDAAFSASEIVIDGSLSEEGWRMSGRVLNAGKQLLAEYGFQWDQTTLFAAVDFLGDMEALALTLNGKTFTVENGKLMLGGAEVTAAQTAVKGDVVEIAVPMHVLGLEKKISEYGKSMEISVKAGGFVSAGKTLILSGIDWFVTDNRDHAAPIAGTKSTDAQHGVTQVENGWRLYDLYDENGTNLTGVRSYVLYQKLPVYMENFADRVETKRFEFDFLAVSMPVLGEEGYVVSGSYANSGFTFSMGDKASTNKDAWTVVCGIMNTKDGLQAVVQASMGNTMLPLNKKVGEKFSFAVEWHPDNSLGIFVDGVQIGTVSNASKYSNSVGNASVCVNMRRAIGSPTCDEESVDVYMTNIAFGKVYSNEGILNKLTFDDIKGANTAADNIVADLVLPATISNGQLDKVYTITWTSSNPAVIDAGTGKVTKPKEGVAVATLTAALPNGETKCFELIILGGKVSNAGILHVTGDTNPAAGVGKQYSDLLFTFDTNNNSIIKDLRVKQKVNFAVLTDGDDRARLNAESLTLWVSDDNVTYTPVKNFKLLQVENKWYLYDFTAEGRYVKVHYTHYSGTEASFIGAYGQMINAGYEAVFGGGKVKFTESQYTLTNSGATRYDHAWTISKKALGITGSDASIRIYLDGELLYHYVDGGDVVVRVPEIAAGASVKLTVKQSGSKDVLDIANKENVYEVTYGTRESLLGSKQRWALTLPAGTAFPNGSKLEKETVYLMGSGSAAVVETSTDGGRTWVSTKVSGNAPKGKTPVGTIHSGSFMFDSVTGRILYQTYIKLTDFNSYDMSVSHMETFVIASDDGGKTWYHMNTLPCNCKEAYKNKNIPQYALSYSEGIQLSTYDGKGENVDFVFPVGVQYNNTGSLATRVAYSRDGGETWQYSESVISYETTGFQGGCSEGWIVEREDGVLVLHTRTEDADLYNFKVSYSLDHGLTWTNDAYFSDYYATNTQAMLKKLHIHGEEVITAIWGGNNAMGGTSYIRAPFNFAASTNGGDTFRNIQNIFTKTHMECYDTRADHFVTNQSVTEFGDDQVLITFQNLRGSKDYIRIFMTDFDKWFTRTKGAYDDFEHGTVQYEGWTRVAGTMELSTVNTRGKYSMKLGSDTSATRSVPYLQNGKISVDVFVKADSVFTLGLQNAYTNVYGVAMPLGIRVENGRLYLNNETNAVGALKEGWNTLTFDLELTEDKAGVAVNDGKAIPIPVNGEAGDYVCYITFGVETDIYVDELLVTSDLDPVLTATQEDQKAADEVVERIRAIATADDKTAAIKAAREAFDTLTQVQADLVDRNALAGNALVNYYGLLVAEEAKTEEYAVEYVEKKIAAIGTVAMESKADIDVARAAYDALTAGQQALVENIHVLTDAEAALKKLQAAADQTAVDQAAAKAVKDKIAAIGTVTLESKADIDVARAAYNALTAGQQALVENIHVLTDAEAALKKLQAAADQTTVDQAAAKAVENKIAAIGTVTLESKAAIASARTAYDALTADQKALVKNYKALADAETTLRELENANNGADTDLPQPGNVKPVIIIVIVLVVGLLAAAVLVPGIRRKRMRK